MIVRLKVLYVLIFLDQNYAIVRVLHILFRQLCKNYGISGMHGAINPPCTPETQQTVNRILLQCALGVPYDISGTHGAVKFSWVHATQQIRHSHMVLGDDGDFPYEFIVFSNIRI